MAISQTTMRSKVRTRLADLSTRRDGTTITTPRWSDANINSAINDAIRDRASDVARRDRSFYLTFQDFTGQTDAVAAAAGPPVIVVNQEYALPTDFRDMVRLARRDLADYPTVPLVPHSVQDSLQFRSWGLFAGFAATYPESTVSSEETCAFVTHAGVRRLRIMPAPGSTSYTYRIFYLRNPTEPGTNLDIPDEWQEVISFDTALLLARDVNLQTVPALERGLAMALEARENDCRGRDGGKSAFGRIRM